MRVNFNNLIRYAIRNGADEAEISYVSVRNRFVKSEGDKFHPTSSNSTDISIRVSIGKRVGSVFTTTLNESLLKEEIDRALSIARISEEDEFWPGFADPGKPLHSSRPYSDEIASLSIEELIRDLERLVGYAKGLDEDIKPYESYLSTITSSRAVYNSRGVEAEDRGTFMQFVIMMKGIDGGKEVSIYDYEVDTKPLTKCEDLIDDLSRRVKALYQAEKLESPIKGPILFRPKPFSELLFFSFVRAIYADNVQEGRSPLKDNVGQTISDSGLSILDDGTVEGALGTSIYDDEGVPRRRTPIIDRGQLKGFLHNTYTARREGLESTGNASRRNVMVLISHSNIRLTGESRDEEKIPSGIDRGIFADGSLLNIHSSNYVTGEINGVIYEAYLIEKGSISKPLRPLALSGNIYEALKSVSMGRDVMQTGYRIISPSIVLGGLTVA